MVSRLTSLMSDSKRDERGSVAILVALAIFVLIIGAGAAVDMARAQILHTKIQSSLDASGLAAIASLPSKPTSYTNDQWATLQANRYFHANFPTGYLQTSPINVNATVSSDTNTISLDASSTQSTTFMSMAGITSVSVGANSKVTRGSTGQKTELILVLDNTLSMNCDVLDVSCTSLPAPVATAKIIALKSAANKLLDIIYGGNDTQDGLFVGVVPFSQAVNIGVDHISWLDSNGNTGTNIVAAKDWGPGGSWAGCVQERTSNGDTEDAPYNFSPFSFAPYWYQPEPETTTVKRTQRYTQFGYYYNYNPKRTPVDLSPTVHNGWKYTSAGVHYESPLDAFTGPNKGCPQVTLPMVTSRTTVSNEIASLAAIGNATLINEGIVWSWRMLSPNWRGLWGGEMDTNNLPLDYNTTDTSTRKVVVLMSDGRNEFLPYYYTALKFLWNYDSTATATSASKAAVSSSLDAKTASICATMKTEGVTIYTIGFGNSSTVNVSLFENCASGSNKVFITPSDAALEEAFTQIGKSLVNLRVSQ